MQAILYVAHGTRLQAGVEEAKSFIQHHIKQIDIPIQVISFIDLASPLMEDGITQCVQQGATDIAVVPILLLEAGHAKHDLPESIRQAKKRYPQVNFSYGAPFGVCDALIDVMVQRLQEQQAITATDSVLIVARGSSDASICDAFAQITRKLKRKIPTQDVAVCYLAAQNPNLSDGLAAQLKNESAHVFVLPYLLFTGLLMQHLDKKVKEINQPNKNVMLCNHLGLSEEISQLLIQNISKCIKKGVNTIAI